MGIHKAKWVRADTDAVPVFRRELEIREPQSASVEICGLGFFELLINGKKVSDDRFVPSFSDYGKRDLSTLAYPTRDRFRCRVYYRRYLLAPYLRKGTNRMEILLGDGWYRQTERTAEGQLSYGEPRLAFSLMADGEEIVSDETLEWRDTPIVFHNLFAGETQDFTHACGAWRPALPTQAPDGALFPDVCPADREIRKIKPVCVFQDGGRTVWDAGENLSGVVRFVMPACPAGTETVVRHAERISSDGTLYTSSAGDIVQTDRYIGDGTERCCEPRFVFHGFRYFEITGPHKTVEVLVIHSDIPVSSAFSSDRPVLDWLYAATVRSLLANMHAGVISDCPHRERLGYTGDGQLTCDTALLLLSAEPLYEKWLLDIADGQDPETGHIQHTAPFYGGGGGPGGWGCAIVTVPYFLFRHTGRTDVVKTFFPNMEKWVSYMESRMEDGLVVREETGGWCLGEWCTPEEIALPAPFVNTYFLIKSLDRMAEMAAALGWGTETLRRKRAAACQALRDAYYEEGARTFCGGVQGADAFALDIGLGDAQMAAALAAKYEAATAFDTGIFGTDALIRVLFETGYADTAVKLLCSTGENSFGGQMARGETTLCERWNVRWASHNHHMFGACTGALFRYLLGIGEREGALFLSPCELKAPLAARGSLCTRFGRVSVERHTKGDKTMFEVFSESDAVFAFRTEMQRIPAGKTVSLVFGGGNGES